MYASFAKRVLDVLVTLAAAPLWLPVIGVIALAVKLDSPGPAFFRQRRGGRGDGWFMIFKFRTMRVDLEAERKGFEPGSKSRVTRFGALLRKSKLDELPQVFNVLLGDMSLVGPRPEVPHWIECYPERWRKVRQVRPGITDPASVVFRDEEELLAAASDPEQEYREVILPRKLELYERYAQELSLAKDVHALFATLLAVLKIK